MSNRAVTVATVVTTVAAYNPRRTALSLHNNGTETIFVSENEIDVANQGFPLAAGTAVDFSEDFGDDPTLSRFAISQTVNNNVRVYEAFTPEGGA